MKIYLLQIHHYDFDDSYVEIKNAYVSEEKCIEAVEKLNNSFYECLNAFDRFEQIFEDIERFHPNIIEILYDDKEPKDSEYHCCNLIFKRRIKNMPEPYCNYILWQAFKDVNLWKIEYKNVEVDYQEVELVDTESFLKCKNNKQEGENK